METTAIESTSGPSRSSRIVKICGVGVAAATAMLAFSAPAHASVGVSPDTGLSATDVVTVSGTLPGFASTATHVTATVCNVDPGVIPGARCDGANASTFKAVGTFTGAGFGLNVDKLFADWSYLGGTGPVEQETETECLGEEGAQCAVVVSYYSAPNFPFGPFTQLGAETHDISFS